MNSQTGATNNLKELVTKQRKTDILSCQHHMPEPIRGVCMFPGPCDSRQLCRTCRKAHPADHLHYYEELDELFFGSLISDTSKAVDTMLKRIDIQNKNLSRVMSSASNRINSIFHSIKQKLDFQAQQLTLHLSELIQAKRDQNLYIRDQLVTTQLDFQHLFDRTKKDYGYLPPNPSLLEEILILYNEISANYIHNVNYQEQLSSQGLDDSVVFSSETIISMTETIKAQTDSLFEELQNHFLNVPALKLEQLPERLKLSAVSSFPTGHKEIIIGALAYIPSLDYLVTGGTEGNIKVWNLQDFSFIAKAVGHKGEIFRINYIAQKDMIITGGRDGEVKLWKIMNNILNMIGNISYDKQAIYAVHYLPNGNLLATGGDGPEIRLWEMVFAGSNPKSQSIQTGASKITALCSLDQAGVLIAATNKGDLLIYNCNPLNHQFLYKMEGHRKNIFALDCDQDRNLIVSGSDDGSIKLWELREQNGECIRSIHREGTMIRSIIYLAESGIVLSTHKDSFVRVWNIETGKLCGSYMDNVNGAVICRWREQGNEIISAFSDSIKILSFS